MLVHHLDFTPCALYIVDYALKFALLASNGTDSALAISNAAFPAYTLAKLEESRHFTTLLLNAQDEFQAIRIQRVIRCISHDRDAVQLLGTF